MIPATHIAVLDDDASVRQALTRLLSASGFMVTAFASADDFLMRRNEVRPNCLLLDVHMPPFGGLDLHSLLSQIDRRLPTVFMTGDRDLARSAALLRTGAPCLMKPFEEDALISAIVGATKSRA